MAYFQDENKTNDNSTNLFDDTDYYNQSLVQDLDFDGKAFSDWFLSQLNGTGEANACVPFNKKAALKWLMTQINQTEESDQICESEHKHEA